MAPFGRYDVRPMVLKHALEVERHRDRRRVTVALPRCSTLTTSEYFDAVIDAVDQALARVAEAEAKSWD